MGHIQHERLPKSKMASSDNVLIAGMAPGTCHFISKSEKEIIKVAPYSFLSARALI